MQWSNNSSKSSKTTSSMTLSMMSCCNSGSKITLMKHLLTSSSMHGHSSGDQQLHQAPGASALMLAFLGALGATQVQRAGNSSPCGLKVLMRLRLWEQSSRLLTRVATSCILQQYGSS